MDFRRNGARIALFLGLLGLIGLWGRTPHPDGLPTNGLVGQPVQLPDKSPSHAAEVARTQNEKERAQRQRFRDDGWKWVDTREAPAPDSDVLELNPEALSGRERELAAALQSNTYSGALLGRIKEIALKASESKTRFVALEALARSPDPKAQSLLVESYGELSREADREQIMGYLRPRAAGDQVSHFLVEQASAPGTSRTLRGQALSALAASALARGESAQVTLRKLPRHLRSDFERIYNTARGAQ